MIYTFVENEIQARIDQIVSNCERLEILVQQGASDAEIQRQAARGPAQVRLSAPAGRHEEPTAQEVEPPSLHSQTLIRCNRGVMRSAVVRKLMAEVKTWRSSRPVSG